MKILAIRHLKTPWNDRQLLQGTIDLSISAPDTDTLQRIEENLFKIKNYPQPLEVFTSCLKRTQETARLYGYESFERDSLLDELDFGSYQEKKRSSIVENVWSQSFQQADQRIFGESISHFEGRIFQFLKKHRDKDRVLLFGHGNWIRALWSLAQFGSVHRLNELSMENNTFIEIDTFGLNP